MNYLLRNCRRVLFVSFLFFVQGVECQNVFVGSNAMLGHVLCNNAEARNYINSPSYGFSFYVGNNCSGDEYWEYFWKNPSVGLGFSYDYIDNSITGNRLGALLFFRPSVYKAERMSVDVYMALGLSYLTKTHHTTFNPHNSYIGSHVNALINIGGLFNYFLSKHFALWTAVKFSHSSNGQLVRPNKGLNFVQLEMGGEYYLQGYNYNVVSVDKFVPYKNCINVSLSPALSQSKYDSQYYPGACLAVAYSRNFHPCFSYGLSCDFMYNGTNITSSSSKGLLLENFSSGLAATFECRLADFALRVALGGYLWHGEYQKLPIYERAGLFYYLGKDNSQYVGVSIKAHAATAEYIEWTYGFSLGC